MVVGYGHSIRMFVSRDISFPRASFSRPGRYLQTGPKSNGGGIDSHIRRRKSDVRRQSLLKGERRHGVRCYGISDWYLRRNRRLHDSKKTSKKRSPHQCKCGLRAVHCENEPFHLILLSYLNPFMLHEAPVEQEGQILERIVSTEVADFSCTM